MREPNISTDSELIIKELAAPLIAAAQTNEPVMFREEDGSVKPGLFTYAGVAQWIAAGTGGLLRHNDFSGWLVYDAATGAFSDKFAESVLYELLKSYIPIIFALIGELKNDGDQKRAFKFYQEFKNMPYDSRCLKALRLEPKIASLPEFFDAEPELVNCCGTVLSADGSAREASPADMFSKSAACRPEEGSPGSFLNYMDWLTCGDAELKEWLLTAFSVSLFGHPTDRIINFYGRGGNGKGTLLRLLYNLLGAYACTLPRSLVIREYGTGSRFDKADLPGKRLAVLADLQVNRGSLNLDDLKKLAGNGDFIEVEKKGKDCIKICNTAKLFVASNEKIPLHATGESEKRRIFLVPFNAKIETKDETLEDKFKAEYGKILNLLHKYAVNYFAEGKNCRKLPPCKAIDAETERYFASEDLIGEFIKDKCTLGRHERVKKTELYDVFHDWCVNEMAIKQPMKIKAFTSALEKKDISEALLRIDGKMARTFSGITLGVNPELFENDNNDYKNSQKRTQSPCTYGNQVPSTESGFSVINVIKDKKTLLGAYRESGTDGVNPAAAFIDALTGDGK